jgi:hypothetical protein
MLSAATLLASCSTGLTCGNSHPYANYNPAPPLKAPAGVTVPAPDPAYAVPAAGTAAKATPAPVAGSGTAVTPAPAAGTNGAQPCLVTPPNVLTKTDMAAPPKTAAPAKPTIPIGTHPGSSGNPPPEQGLPPPPVARRGSME